MKKECTLVSGWGVMTSARELEKTQRTEISRARLRSKIACMASKVPVYSVLNTALVIYRKRSNMRRAFVIFLTICLTSFSLDSRFVYSPRPRTL